MYGTQTHYVVQVEHWLPTFVFVLIGAHCTRHVCEKMDKAFIAGFYRKAPSAELGDAHVSHRFHSCDGTATLEILYPREVDVEEEARNI